MDSLFLLSTSSSSALEKMPSFKFLSALLELDCCVSLFCSPTSTIGGTYAFSSETSMFFDAGIGSTSSTVCKVRLFFSCDCGVLLIRGAEETFVILGGVCVARVERLSVSRKIL